MRLLSKITEKIKYDILGQNKISLQLHNSQVAQKHLFATYQNFAKQKDELPDLRDTGFRVYSQTDEDGIILYIFSLIGFTNKLLVDIAFATPYGANTTNLICNWGFSGLLVEGNQNNIDLSNSFFSSHPDTCIFPPKAICRWVSADNINELLENNDISGDIDLFSLDIDGIDYWLWKKMTVVRPRVVIIEAQTFWGPEKSVTVPYNSEFIRTNIHPDYFGASIQAFVKLGREKGYRLVGCNRFGFNIIFVRNDIGKDVLPEIATKECFRRLPPGLAIKRQKRLDNVKNFEWIEV